jgi:cytochrome P450
MVASTSPRMPGGPRGLPLLGNTLDAWRDPIELMTRALADHGDIVRLQFGPHRYFVLNHPDAIKHVLVDHPKNYTKSRNYDGLKLVLGRGLLTSEGEAWRQQRKIAQPAFHRERLGSFARSMVRCTDDLLEQWEPRRGERVDVHAEMMRLTLRIVGQTFFGADVDRDAAAIGEALRVVIQYAHGYVEQIVQVPVWVPTPRNVRFRKAMRTLDGVVRRIIDERRRSGEAGDDLLAMYLSARDESGEPLPDDLVRDEVMTMVLAGHETTANALTWSWYLLSRRPDVARRVREEVHAVLGDRAPDVADLPRLDLCTRVVQESLRLYPPAWSFERQAVEDDEVMGFSVPAGTIIGMCPYILHRSRAWWDDPETFDPDRFTPERSAARPRYAYLPFGGGPRTCIGSAFAMMEAQIVVAMIARRFAFEAPPERNVEIDLDITLRPRNGMKLRLDGRATATAA